MRRALHSELFERVPPAHGLDLRPKRGNRGHPGSQSLDGAQTILCVAASAHPEGLSRVVRALAEGHRRERVRTIAPGDDGNASGQYDAAPAENRALGHCRVAVSESPRRCNYGAGHRSADMGGVVDGRSAQVRHHAEDDEQPEPARHGLRKRTAPSLHPPSDDERGCNDPGDGAGGPDAGHRHSREPSVADAQHVAERTCCKIHRRHPRRADRPLDERPRLPESEHVEGNVHDASVQEARGDHGLPAALADGRRRVARPELEQLAHREGREKAARG